MKEQYSVAICPPADIIIVIDGMKDSLAAKIGWYHSRNSKGHITFNVFEADESEMPAIKGFLARFCRNLVAASLSFNQTGSYPNGAFYLSPDEASKDRIAKVMEQFHCSFPLQKVKKSCDPHLSIARRLKGEKLLAAAGMFSGKQDISFLWDRLSLRKFNGKQYFIESEFLFSG